MSSHSGERVYRVHWLPGTDILRGSCHCGAERLAEEPIELWEWLLAHPQGHQAAAVPAPDPPTRVAMPA
ncbi:hypothetical protein O7614_14175 [Micromonospora sp. WMMD961]|uniref:hypothetical protein n=1 Tax=Micromonospora sp. WMMD961 TaxID=3016100 RepID=UPI0024177F61|nr:hypothetical protein [Micromonospora sp. WMMD961]MDG4780789.1 hypothetical protein [Micromonospora sp. WMMD961]